MTRKFATTAFAAIVAAILASAPLGSIAQTSTNSTNQPPKHRIVPVPFHGQISAVDKAKQTITFVDASKVSTTIFINADTKVTPDDKKATLDEAAVGDTCGGQYALSEDGLRVARTLHFGLRKPKKNTAPAPPVPVQKN
jgi:hypothetical protein